MEIHVGWLEPCMEPHTDKCHLSSSSSWIRVLCLLAERCGVGVVVVVGEVRPIFSIQAWGMTSWGMQLPSLFSQELIGTACSLWKGLPLSFFIVPSISALRSQLSSFWPLELISFFLNSWQKPIFFLPPVVPIFCFESCIVDGTVQNCVNLWPLKRWLLH